MEVTAWEDPQGRASSGKAARVAATLKANPGKSAVIETLPLPADDGTPETKTEIKRVRARASSRASLIQQGRVLAFQPKGEFKAVSRTKTDDDGKRVIRVFACYVGPEGASSDASAAAPQPGDDAGQLESPGADAAEQAVAQS